jgi:hypothetical protein
MIRTTIFIAVLILLFSTICMSDPCRFEHPGKGVIDITSLGRTDGTAAYADRIPSGQSTYSMLILFLAYIRTTRYLLIIEYSYNPCKPFSEGFHCTNVAVCQSKYWNMSTLF